MSYDINDARADVANEKFEALVDDALDKIVSPIIELVQSMSEDAYYPHPWTYERSLLTVWLEDGDDGLTEHLEEEYREDAEEAVRDQEYDSEPCCSQFSCPCGNSNNFRGL